MTNSNNETVQAAIKLNHAPLKKAQEWLNDNYPENGVCQRSSDEEK